MRGRAGPRRRPGAVLLGLLLLGVGGGCRQEEGEAVRPPVAAMAHPVDPAAAEPSPSGSGGAFLREPPAETAIPAAGAELPQPSALVPVRAEPVQGRTGPGGGSFEVALRTPGRVGHDRMFGRRPFDIALRSEGLASYPCASCHLPGKQVIRDERVPDAHQNLKPVHPSESGARCLTCHAPDDVERLALESGERVSIDHAYRLCAQCHFVQADAWAGGGHGKRLDGWSGRRVVMGCADCHDPHRPALVPRMPFAGPRLPLSGHQGR